LDVARRLTGMYFPTADVGKGTMVIVSSDACMLGVQETKRKPKDERREYFYTGSETTRDMVQTQAWLYGSSGASFDVFSPT
jgi:hypothetical protein